jgi:hypothetical protein
MTGKNQHVEVKKMRPESDSVKYLVHLKKCIIFSYCLLYILGIISEKWKYAILYKFSYLLAFFNRMSGVSNEFDIISDIGIGEKKSF